uniref:Putative cysteine-rich protease inhibitor n=1 Tax=Culex tarsalis TaxID=7177 RepID=A0A1Q3FAV9_CULTA
MKKCVIFLLSLMLICIESIPFDHSCGENAEYHGCASACAIPTCANPNPEQSPHRACIQVCIICVCKSGYLRNQHGNCVQQSDCQQT